MPQLLAARSRQAETVQRQLPSSGARRALPGTGQRRAGRACRRAAAALRGASGCRHAAGRGRPAGGQAAQHRAGERQLRAGGVRCGAGAPRPWWLSSNGFRDCKCCDALLKATHTEKPVCYKNKTCEAGFPLCGHGEL